MKKKILDVLNTTAGQLIFALVSGCGYFMILLRVIIEWSRGSALLAAYFSPLIICGAAIVIIKLIKQAREAENDGAIIKLFALHVILVIIGILFLAAGFVK